jgi:hypothetical protein
MILRKIKVACMEYTPADQHRKIYKQELSMFAPSVKHPLLSTKISEVESSGHLD